MKISGVSLEMLPQAAAQIASILQPGHVILVDAPMGYGKTTLAKQLVAALGGNAQEVTSPTFSLVQSYPLSSNRVFHHIDLYRLDNTEDLYDLGMESYLTNNAIVYIEWPQHYADAGFEAHFRLSIEKDGALRNFSLEEN